MHNLKKRAELALLMSLRETVSGIQKYGRLRNLIDKIEVEAKKEYDKKFNKISTAMKIEISAGFDRFDNYVGWTKRQRHILTYLSAITLFIEGYGYTKIESLILEVVDYYERQGNAPAACFWPAEKTKEYWDKSFDLA